MKKALKNTLVLLIIGAMLFLLTGCGKKEEESKKEEKPEEEQKTEFSMGKWEDNVYSNDFLGLKFNLPDDWKYSSKEKIAEMMNLGSELLNDDQKAAAEIAKLNAAYYMMANNPNSADSIIVMSEKSAMDYTTEFYINQLKSQLTSVSSIKYTIEGTSKEKVGDKECDTLTASATSSGLKMTQKYYVYKIDNYFIAIIATTMDGESGINEMMSNFSIK